MNVSRGLLGTRLYNKCMKATIYGQFVAGETVSELQKTTEMMQENNFGPMLCLPIEEDAGHELYAKHCSALIF